MIPLSSMNRQKFVFLILLVTSACAMLSPEPAPTHDLAATESAREIDQYRQYVECWDAVNNEAELVEKAAESCDTSECQIAAGSEFFNLAGIFDEGCHPPPCASTIHQALRANIKDRGHLQIALAAGDDYTVYILKTELLNRQKALGTVGA